MRIETVTMVDMGTTYTNNDDRAMVGAAVYDEGLYSRTVSLPVMAAVCDGVGGNAGGGYAANLLLTELAAAVPETAEELAQLLDRADRTLRREQTLLPGFSHMCSTIAGAVFHPDRTLVFHSGDSRVYRFDGRYLNLLTHDHSVVQELIDRGSLTEEEAAVSGGRNQITRCMGGRSPLPPEITLLPRPIGRGETFLICSDGLWDVVTPQLLRQVLGGELPLTEQAQTLVELAKARGSVDNITVCLCRPTGERVRRAETTTFILD